MIVLKKKAPSVIRLVSEKTNPTSKIIDIGCGCGFLTNKIYKNGRRRVTGIDISLASIEYAQKRYPDILFLCDEICKLDETKCYDLALAVMVLNNMPDVKSFFSTIGKLLAVGGTLIVVLPHPCF